MGIVQMKIHFLKSERRQVHYISNVEIQHPVFKSVHPKKGFYIRAESFRLVLRGVHGRLRSHPCFDHLLYLRQQLVIASDACWVVLVLLLHELAQSVVRVELLDLVLQHLKDRVHKLNKQLELFFIILVEVK
jgi:hypothetical protein